MDEMWTEALSNTVEGKQWFKKKNISGAHPHYWSTCGQDRRTERAKWRQGGGGPT